MEKFKIIDLNNKDHFIKIGYSVLHLSDKNTDFSSITTNEEHKILVMDRPTAEVIISALDEISPGRFVPMPIETAPNVAEDLNGFVDLKMKVITEIIQELDPIKFAQACEDLCSNVNPDTLLTYSTHSHVMPTNRGPAMAFIAMMQYWGTEDQYQDWLKRLKEQEQRSKIIMP